MPVKRKFSIRQGVKSEPSPSLQEAPAGLRYFLLKYLEEKHRGYPSAAASLLEDFLRQPGLKSKFYNVHDPSVWTRLYEYIKGFEWWEVYDFIEFLYLAENDSYLRTGFVEKVNKVLAEENAHWQMQYGGEIVYRGSSSFESAVGAAAAALLAAGRNTAMSELRKASEDLSKRPNPDLTGAVQHAMAALECVAADVCGAEGQTLGQIVKRNPDRFPRPVGDAIAMLYGFASERGRHIAEGAEPELKEAELIVGIAATLATYLSH